MELGIYATSHGIGYRDGENFFAHDLDATAMRPVEVAQRVEAAGFHSMWFPDHVCMPQESTSGHVANASRTRAYQSRHNMLDAAVLMGAVASATTTLKLGNSVLIAPYRGPLNDARQFATVDVLSNGRLILGVGAGWMEEEFTALGLSHRDRGAMTEECIEIYKRSWCDDVVSFRGEHYDFQNLSMDPKPVQTPRPPIIFGSVAPAGARRAAKFCDGLYPIFLDPGADPARFANLQEIVRRELAREGKDPAAFNMLALASMRVTDAAIEGSDRAICTGSPEQVLADLERFAKAGYTHVVVFYDCPSGEVDELLEQIERTGKAVIPAAAGIAADGGFKKTL
jgi:probable F420-dependent oxidoreductase